MTQPSLSSLLDELRIQTSLLRALFDSVYALGGVGYGYYQHHASLSLDAWGSFMTNKPKPSDRKVQITFPSMNNESAHNRMKIEELRAQFDSTYPALDGAITHLTDAVLRAAFATLRDDDHPIQQTSDIPRVEVHLTVNKNATLSGGLETEYSNGYSTPDQNLSLDTEQEYILNFFKLLCHVAMLPKDEELPKWTVEVQYFTDAHYVAYQTTQSVHHARSKDEALMQFAARWHPAFLVPARVRSICIMEHHPTPSYALPSLIRNLP